MASAALLPGAWTPGTGNVAGQSSGHTIMPISREDLGPDSKCRLPVIWGLSRYLTQLFPAPDLGLLPALWASTPRLVLSLYP